jgi:hypothetical protein
MAVTASIFAGKTHDSRGVAFWSDSRPDRGVRGAALNSLSESELFDRFYSWRGISGARYVCTVFPVGEKAIVADFAEGVVIGVAREGESRRPVCIISSQEFSACDEKKLRQVIARRGVDEWHVHFTADDREICADLTLCC